MADNAWQYDVIIGWDFGHGENTVECVRQGTRTSIALKLNSSGDKEQPTAILYRDGQIKIGNEAKHSRGAIPYFKERPDLWHLKIAGRSKREMMSDYFRLMMQNIRKYNPDEIHDDDRILLLVGCPATGSWLEAKKRSMYKQLILNATGVTEAIIIPESRAALLSAFTPHTHIQVNTSDGAIVFDFGSYTADFTYMMLGKHLIERSCTLGASHIERAMLRVILEHNGLNPGDIWEEEIGVIELKLRELKERYYAEGELLAQILTPTIIDGDGKPIAIGTDRRGQDRYQQREIIFRIDDDSMDKVINEVAFNIDEDGLDLGNRSWRSHLQSFMLACKSMLDGAKPPLPYHSIILTGGASHMPFVKEVCEEIFGRKVIVENNPSRSVSKGLCFAGSADQRIPELLASGIGYVRKKANDEYSVMFAACLKNLTDRIYERMSIVFGKAADNAENITIEQLKDALEKDVIHNLTSEDARSIIKDFFKEWQDKCALHIVETANSAVSSIYPDIIDAEHFRIPSDPEAIALASVEQSIVDVTALITNINFQSMINKILTVVIASIIAVIIAFSLGQPWLTPLITYIVSQISDGISRQSNRTLGPKDRKRLWRDSITNCEKWRTVISDQIQPVLAAALDEYLGVNNEKFFILLDEATEQAFDVVALRRFKHRDDMDLGGEEEGGNDDCFKDERLSD